MATPSEKIAQSLDVPKQIQEANNSPIVKSRAVLGHFIFTFIHPYMDGNGRMGRFMMNVMLASGGYRWTIIQKDIRDKYMSTLERASVHGEIGGFASLLSSLLTD